MSLSSRNLPKVAGTNNRVTGKRVEIEMFGPVVTIVQSQTPRVPIRGVGVGAAVGNVESEVAGNPQLVAVEVPTLPKVIHH